MNLRKRMNLFLGVLILAGGLCAQNLHVSTPKTSLVLSVPQGGKLRYMYYGNKLTQVDLRNFNATDRRRHWAPSHPLTLSMA